MRLSWGFDFFKLRLDTNDAILIAVKWKMRIFLYPSWGYIPHPMVFEVDSDFKPAKDLGDLKVKF